MTSRTTPVHITIYVRLAGSDATGDGTLANPYFTVQRAARDVPNTILPGHFYHVDFLDASTSPATKPGRKNAAPRRK